MGLRKLPVFSVNFHRWPKLELREGELTLFPADENGLFEAITAAISNNHWQVSALRLEVGRLDEVFRSITR